MVTQSILYIVARSLYKIIYVSSPKLSRSPRIQTESPSPPCRSSNIPRYEWTAQITFFTVILAETFQEKLLEHLTHYCDWDDYALLKTIFFEGWEGKISILLSGFTKKLFHDHVLWGTWSRMKTKVIYCKNGKSVWSDLHEQVYLFLYFNVSHDKIFWPETANYSRFGQCSVCPESFRPDPETIHLEYKVVSAESMRSFRPD